jgi:hypothetical protein
MRASSFTERGKLQNDDWECREKCKEEVILGDVACTGPHLLLDLSTVRLLDWAKTSNIERLEYVR